MFDELIGKVVLLDNNKYYQVIWSKQIDNRTFLYLLNQDDFSEPMFCEKTNEGLSEITDKNFLQQVILSIAKEINTFAM